MGKDMDVGELDLHVHCWEKQRVMKLLRLLVRIGERRDGKIKTARMIKSYMSELKKLLKEGEDY